MGSVWVSGVMYVCCAIWSVWLLFVVGVGVVVVVYINERIYLFNFPQNTYKLRFENLK